MVKERHGSVTFLKAEVILPMDLRLGGMEAVFMRNGMGAVWRILGLGARIRPAAVAMADAHMRLDIYQERAGREVGRELHLLILPVPQLCGLAIRILPKDLGLHRFITVDFILVTLERRQTYL